MGTTYQALSDYANNLRAIQMVARAWGVGPNDYALIKPTLMRALTDCSGQMAIIRTAVQESTVADEYKTALDGLIVSSFDETALIVADPTRTDGELGKLAQVGPGGWTAVVVAAQKASKSLIRLFYYVIGISVAAGGTVLVGPWIWRQITDPYGFKQQLDVWTGQQDACARAMSAAGSDPEKLASARSFCDLMRVQAEDEIGGGGCGLLDTPIGTLLGLAVGIGFGWVGLRKIMSL